MSDTCDLEEEKKEKRNKPKTLHNIIITVMTSEASERDNDVIKI